MTDETKCIVKVYLDDGRIFSYEVPSHEKAREHHHAIAQNGYRHNDGSVFETYPPHRITKIKTVGNIPTNYLDKTTGT